MRAYSVGSRLEHSKRKFRMDHSLSSSLASNSSASSRTRAYSVGSRAKMPRSDQYKSSFVGSPAQIALYNSVQHAQQYPAASSFGSSSDANNNSNKVANTNNKKSSSVPMLDGMGDIPLERVTDFMEMDFSSISIGKINESDDYVLTDNLTPVSQPSLEHDYLNMEPAGSRGGSGKTIPEGYVEMRPGGGGGVADSVPPSMSNSPIRQQQHHGSSGGGGVGSGSSNNSNLTNNVINRSSSNSSNCKPSSSLKSSSTSSHEESDYLDMRGKDTPSVVSKLTFSSSLIKRAPPPANTTKTTLLMTLSSSSSSSYNSSRNEDYLNMAPLNRDLTEHSVDVHHAPPSLRNGSVGDTPMTITATASNVMTSSAEEGYLEMSFSRSNSIGGGQSASSADFNAQQESYMSARKPMTSNRSLPININYNSNSAAAVPAPAMTPITPRNNVGLFSKLSSLEEVHSPIQATTPGKGNKGVTPTMFPFSPASPAAGGEGATTTRPKFQHQTSQQRSSASPLSSIGGAIGVGEIVHARKILVDGTTGTLKLSDGGSRRKVAAEESLDYVNYEPPSQRRDSNRTEGATPDDDMQSDYVLMNPLTKLRRKSSGAQKTVIATGNFRPIQSSADQEVMDGPSPQKALLFNRQLSLNTVSETGAQRIVDESPYELLRTTSGGGGSGGDLSSMLRGSGKKSVSTRPSSVNSDKITSRISNLSLNRPNSANSDRLSTISSSSSSTSTLCGGNSSSSSSTATLCGGVKSHSPMLMTRVPSDPSSASTQMDDNNSAILKSLPKMNTASSMDKELHYASLDLPACSSAAAAPLAKPELEFLVKSCRNSTDSSSTSGSETATHSPSVLMGEAATTAPALPAFNYAQLDFAKCEAMKQEQQ